MKMTIKDVAKLADVSIATVSRVINEDPSVRRETVEKVQQAIQDTNYVPNTYARSLKTDTTKIIGLLVSDLSNNHFMTMAKALETILSEHGYSLVVCNTDDNAEKELLYLSRLCSLRVDGLILDVTPKNNIYIADLSKSIPIVLIERRIANENFIGDLICSNNFSGIYTATKYLVNSGHRKIGIINTELKVSTGKERFEGFVSAMSEVGITVDAHYPYKYDSKIFSVEGGILGCQYLMEKDDRPSAIIATNNTIALGIYKYLRKKNISVPKDVSVLSYGNIENSELFNVIPGHTTLDPNYIGERAAKLLLSRIDAPRKPNKEIVIEPSLVVNESVASI